MIASADTNLKSKLPDVGTTIFTTMSQMAQQYNALNLSQGFPTFDPPALLTERLFYHVKNSSNQYAPMAGVPALREALSEKADALYHRYYHPDTEITITSGATEALFAAISAVVGVGDEVIVIEPAYDSYVPAIRLCGGIPVYLTLSAPDFEVDFSRLRDLISPKTRLIIINTPNNPTGTIWKSTDLDQLAELLKGNDIYLISDEVYEHIVFDGYEHISVMTHNELAPRAFVIGSFGKTYHITGWKVGYCYAPEALTREFRKVHQFLTFSVSTPAQFALADILKEKEYYLELGDFYEKKRDLFNTSLLNSRFHFKPASGTFFQTVSFEGLSGETDLALVERLTREYGVAAIPVSAFFHNSNSGKIIRFCFAKDDKTLLEAGERLSKIHW